MQVTGSPLSLGNKRIVLGVTGGIAAYKSAELVRRLRDAGAEVRVVMTEAAQQFIAPLTFQALSGNPVHCHLLDPAAEAAMGHIELARWADLLLIAPASADCMARLAAGVANDLLTTLCLAARSPIALAPAMNQAMWAAAANQDNITTLRARGVQLFGPAEGAQACGDTGPGRMLEPPEIVERAAALFVSGVLSGHHVVITAGPTREAIDPVRFISNHSSGRMGYALAEACVDAGARVTLISGPVHLPTPDRVQRINVVSAQDMHREALQQAPASTVFIACAAVADYRPQTIAEQKIKKGADTLTLTLVKNPDIVADVAALPAGQRPFTVGFAAETCDVEHHAQEKLQRKKLDMIACNDVANTRIGFNSEHNALTVFWNDGRTVLAEAAKGVVARELVALIAARLAQERFA